MEFKAEVRCGRELTEEKKLSREEESRGDRVRAIESKPFRFNRKRLGIWFYFIVFKIVSFYFLCKFISSCSLSWNGVEENGIKIMNKIFRDRKNVGGNNEI